MKLLLITLAFCFAEQTFAGVPGGAPCAAGQAGLQHYSAGTYEFCDGTNFRSMKGPVATACIAADAGKSRYTSGRVPQTMQFCDGTNWYDMKGTTLSACTASETGKQKFIAPQLQFCDGINWYSMAYP